MHRRYAVRDEVHVHSASELPELVASALRTIAAARERRARVAWRRALRPRLRWLVDHPRLLKLAVRARLATPPPAREVNVTTWNGFNVRTDPTLEPGEVRLVNPVIDCTDLDGQPLDEWTMRARARRDRHMLHFDADPDAFRVTARQADELKEECLRQATAPGVNYWKNVRALNEMIRRPMLWGVPLRVVNGGDGG